MAGKKDEKKEYSIAAIRTLVDTEKRMITEFDQVLGTEMGSKTYRGQAMLVLQHPNPQVPDQQLKLEFSFPEGTSMGEAFKGFDKMAKEARDEFMKKQQEEAERAKVLGANAPIMGLDGRSIG